MDKRRLQMLADTIREAEHINPNNALKGWQSQYAWENPPTQFNLGFFFEKLKGHPCQTVGCIIGYGLGMTGGISASEHKISGLMLTFSRRFDIPHQAACNLGDPASLLTRNQYHRVTPEDAAKAVKNVIGGAVLAREIWSHVQPLE